MRHYSPYCRGASGCMCEIHPEICYHTHISAPIHRADESLNSWRSIDHTRVTKSYASHQISTRLPLAPTQKIYSPNLVLCGLKR